MKVYRPRRLCGFSESPDTEGTGLTGAGSIGDTPCEHPKATNAATKIVMADSVRGFIMLSLPAIIWCPAGADKLYHENIAHV
jgi:hypothetical protein